MQLLSHISSEVSGGVCNKVSIYGLISYECDLPETGPIFESFSLRIPSYGISLVGLFDFSN